MNKFLLAPIARLFRKFFLAIFVAQLLTVVGVGLLIWAVGPEPHLPEPEERAHHGVPAPVRALQDRLTPGPLPGPLPGPPPGLEDRPPPPGPPPGPEDRPPPAAPGFGPGWGPAHDGGWLWFGRRTHRHGFPFLPVGVGLLAALLSAFVLARQFAGPILALRQAFAELGQGNLRVRLGPGLRRHADELDALRTDFDATAAKLESLVEGQRRLLHDVSHEIRSPIARLQLALDLIRQQPARAGELLERMERECGRIDLLMEELLTLSRLEAGAFGPLDQMLDLVEIVQAITEDAGFEGAARQVRVAFAGPSELECRGHGELLHRAIENVVRNAVAHSPDGAAVRVELRSDPLTRRVRLVVEDEGSGVPAGDLERIFAPFKRLNGVSLQQTATGHGLGLAITREAMVVHGGRAWAENRSPGGLRVVVELPLAGA